MNRDRAKRMVRRSRFLAASSSFLYCFRRLFGILGDAVTVGLGYSFHYRPWHRGGENFLEQLGLLQILLGGGRLFVTIVVIVIAGAAPNLGGICID